MYPYERLDDLQLRGLYIFQDTRGFRFGVDAVLLADFAAPKKGGRVLDMCTGNGIIPILLSAKTHAEKITGIEIMQETADMARRSVEYNKIENIEIVCGDVKNAARIFGHEVFDVVTCNPPYKKAGSGLQNPNDLKAVSRHEILCTLEDVAGQSAAVLRFGGKLCMVHQTSRLTDVVFTLKKYGLEPKRLRLIAPSKGKEPNLFLIEGAKGGGEFLKVLPTLYIYDEGGNYTPEINRIYEREKI